MATSPPQLTSDSNAHQTGGSSFTPVASAQEHLHRYLNDPAFEDFTNRNRDKVVNALRRIRGPQLTEEETNCALVSHWEDMGPEEKRDYGDRTPRREPN